MNISGEASLPIRPTYLGNYTLETSNEIVRFTQKFSLWENFRKSLTGKALPIIIIVFLLFIGITFYDFIKHRKSKTPDEYYLEISARIMLVVFAAAEFILPVVGNGEADLAKHMFLFNILFDMMLIMLIADIIKFVESRLLNKGIIFVTLVLLAFCAGGNYLVEANSKNDILTFGTYEGKALTWEILEETEEYYFIVSKDVITNHVFSKNTSNLWMYSDVKRWLNSDFTGGFLRQFTLKEKSAIKPVPLKTLLAPAFKEQAEFGRQPHYWSCALGNVTQNYDSAYAVISDERVFLLSVKEWDSYNFDKKKNTMYWLRTPYDNERVVRVVGKDGYVYHKLADMQGVGVLPAMYVKKIN
jgi:hypothetical protein